MKLFKKSAFILTLLVFSSVVNAWPEIPFCPAGGPPGWMNYFDYKRNQNTLNYTPTYNTPYYYPGSQYPGYSNSPPVSGPQQRIQPYRSPAYGPRYR